MLSFCFLTVLPSNYEYKVVRIEPSFKREHTSPNNYKNGAPGRTRTCDHLLRRQVLYPTELQAQYGGPNRTRTDDQRIMNMVGRTGFEPVTSRL